MCFLELFGVGFDAKASLFSSNSDANSCEIRFI